MARFNVKNIISGIESPRNRNIVNISEEEAHDLYFDLVYDLQKKGWVITTEGDYGVMMSLYTENCDYHTTISVYEF